MSADRWSHCPRCKARKKAELDRMAKAVEGYYGKVPVTEYTAYVEELERSRKAATQIPDSLREDWEVYLESENLMISYSCSCYDCGFAFAHNDVVKYYEEEEEEL